MLDFTKTQGGPKPKCLVTHSTLSTYIDHNRPPNKKRPFNIIRNQTYSHTFDLLLPETAATSFGKTTTALTYLQVNMKLLEILTGDFFNKYIKSSGSNILMLSETLNDYQKFSLREGVLRLEVDKPTFEKLGLEGKAISSEGRKHVKARFVIEIDLRGPNMVHGKKGFERLVWACKNVLVEAVTWLFVDLSTTMEKAGDAVEEDEPIKQFAPTTKTASPEIHAIPNALVPAWPQNKESSSSTSAEFDHEDAADLLEWLSLAILGSPRISQDDNIDPYLSRYQVPNSFGDAKPQNLVRCRWHGLIHPDFAQKVFLEALKASGESHEWMAISAAGFEGEGYTVLIYEGKQCVSWEYKD